MLVHGADGFERELLVHEGETLLDGGLRLGLALPYECRNGGCGVCLCSIEHGAVEHRPYQRSALPDELRAQGKALLCCAVPIGDVAIDVPGLVGSGAGSGSAQHVYTGRVAAIERLAPEVMRVLIELPEHGTISFSAGQYINILVDGGRRAFSFANPPHRNEPIELHVRRIPGGRFTGHVFEQMKVGDELRFEGPLGHFTLNEGDRPILFVAGATGFAPVKSIIEDAFHRGIRRPMRLYWGVRHRSDLYMLDLAQSWQREHPQFTVVPVLSDPSPEDAWDGRTGLVHEAILKDFPDLSGHELYVCGSMKMVETAVPAFLGQGLPEGACFSDAFLPSRAVAVA